MADKQPKTDALRAMREAKFAAKSSVSPGDEPALYRDYSGESEPSVTLASSPGENKSDGGVESRHAEMSMPIRSGERCILGCRPSRGHDAAIAGVASGPSETNPKRGRPRIGEVRTKPWLTCDPPMSERTWRRRQKESKT